MSKNMEPDLMSDIQKVKEADPGFLERGFIFIKVCVCGGGGGLRFADFISFFLNTP